MLEKPLIVRVLYFDGCPHHATAARLVRDAARDLGLAVELELVRVRSRDDLEALRFLGSPTVQVDGVDVEPSARSRSDFAFACRVYGSSGTPTRESIVAALRGERS